MSFAARNALRLSRAANTTALSQRAAVAARCFSATRANRVQDTANKKNVVREKEVPVTIYGHGHGEGDKHTVRVSESASQVPFETPQPPTEDVVKPLSKNVYESLPHTLRNMSLFGKTVIIHWWCPWSRKPHGPRLR